MKALVTGADGFVGRYLVDHLRSQGDDVAPIDRAQADIADADAVHAVVAEVQPDVVYHLAAASHVGESWKAPQRVFRINAEGACNVLYAAAEGGVDRVLLVGSAEEYGTITPDQVPITEDTPLRPTTPYGASKVAASFLGLQVGLARGLEVIRTRSFNHTGPGQDARFLVPALAQRVARVERGELDGLVVGSLDPVRDITDVRDVVRAYRYLVVRGVPGEVYNVCRGEGRAVREIVDLMLGAANLDVRVEIDPELVRPVETPILVGDRSRLTRATGWEPEYSLATTIDDMLVAARTALEATSSRLASPDGETG